MVGILVAPLLWTTQLGLAVEGWRRAFGSADRRWLAMVGQTEALASLASYAYEHPALPVPDHWIVDEAGPRLRRRGAWPSAPARRRVRPE